MIHIFSYTILIYIILLFPIRACRDHSGHLLVGCEDHVCQNVILNLSAGIPRDIVGITMSLVIILSYILILAPAREHIERYVIRFVQPATEKKDDICRNAVRTTIVLSTILVALKAPYFGSMMGAVGGLTDAVQCFVFPPLIFLKLQVIILGYERLFYCVCL